MQDGRRTEKVLVVLSMAHTIALVALPFYAYVQLSAEVVKPFVNQAEICRRVTNKGQELRTGERGSVDNREPINHPDIDNLKI